MKQVGKFGIWVPEDTDAPDAPTQLKQLAEGTESTDGVNDLLDRAGAQTKKSIISAEQSRTNVAFGVLGTADQVTGLVLPEDGLIFVAYTALWKSSVAGAGRAAIHLGNNAIKRWVDNSPPIAQEAATSSSEANKFGWLVSYPLGLAAGQIIGGSGNEATHVTTGQVVGGLPSKEDLILGGAAVIFAAAGTYDVSVRFRATSGSVSAKERKLWVWSKAF